MYELDSLQKEIDNRKRSIPQTYKEALNRTEAVHEITRLYDVCSQCFLYEHIFYVIINAFRHVNELYNDSAHQQKS